ncbi:type II secretion system protein J [Marinibactrum halimedae]|uniref:MSHA biogenesis protein MshO n=1 Tax=Marinibactrum halimedae TaxID=1444977 RepID=A0AA37WMY8_9GAMM|nr:prepilin-type N-terminal cleavage/methylation domain-containing protein [Marinibactrum halimedae]MCD9460816.1 prepilin-type N-terminal cleavage/methylation domain-containing protein [Marinibactrum halimedae]GLS26720.1 MSHA biogenesis protein MshO [Marinibactrum halimedae]
MVPVKSEFSPLTIAKRSYLQKWQLKRVQLERSPLERSPYRRQQAFTLIELITVMVILSILAVLSTQFVTSSITSYTQSKARFALTQKGRQALERITRELRMALPNSVRSNSSGQCIEYIPIIGGANYLGVVGDVENGNTTSTLNTAPLSLSSGVPVYVSVGGLLPSELYASGSSSAALALWGGVDTSIVPNVVSHSAKQFVRNSVNRRMFVATFPRQICVSGDQLRLYDAYTPANTYPLNSALSLGTPSGNSVLLMDGVNGAAAFSVSLATETVNTLVSINLPISEANQAITLSHQVMIRNVP